MAHAALSGFLQYAKSLQDIGFFGAVGDIVVGHAHHALLYALYEAPRPVDGFDCDFRVLQIAAKSVEQRELLDMLDGTAPKRTLHFARAFRLVERVGFVADPVYCGTRSVVGVVHLARRNGVSIHDARRERGEIGDLLHQEIWDGMILKAGILVAIATLAGLDYEEAPEESTGERPHAEGAIEVFGDGGGEDGEGRMVNILAAGGLVLSDGPQAGGEGGA